ncbi:MAG: hypothetical protein JWO44_1666 [Bacteroidetes bacterium]|jgi:hypothetical protein|nr:hypothetical protein [Bacteroidota bacterium]
MQLKIAKYILFLFFSVFVTNAIVSLVLKNSGDSELCAELEDDCKKEAEKKENNKKFSFSPNSMPFDDDICHEFHFTYYFVTIKHLKYGSPDPSLLDASLLKLYSPPKA